MTRPLPEPTAQTATFTHDTHGQPLPSPTAYTVRQDASSVEIRFGDSEEDAAVVVVLERGEDGLMLHVWTHDALAGRGPDHSIPLALEVAP